MCGNHQHRGIFLTHEVAVGYSMAAIELHTVRTKSPSSRRAHRLARVGRRFADGDGYQSKEPVHVSNVSDLLWGKSALLFFTCFDNAVLLFVGFAYLGNRCLKSLRPMDFKKCLMNVFDCWLVLRSLIVHSRLLNGRTSSENATFREGGNRSDRLLA
jgi:hypothetical protein